MRSRLRCLGQRLPPAPFLLRRFVRLRPGSCIAIVVIVVLAGSGLRLPPAAPARPPRTAPVDLLTVARFCGCAWLPAVRAAESRYLFCSVRSRSSCAARSSTIFCSVSGIFRQDVRIEGHRAVSRLVYSLSHVLQAKTDSKLEMFYVPARRYRLRRVAVLRSIPLSSAPNSCAVISRRRSVRRRRTAPRTCPPPAACSTRRIRRGPSTGS